MLKCWRVTAIEVDTAEDGMAGWKALHAVRHAPESYALLITDHEMPGLSGLALVKKARAARMALPVIMATGTLPPEDLFTRYPWLQPAAALVKPYSVGQLLGTVEKVLRATVTPTRRLRRRPTGKASQYRMVCCYDDSNPRSSVQSRFLRLGHLCGVGFIKSGMDKTLHVGRAVTRLAFQAMKTNCQFEFLVRADSRCFQRAISPLPPRRLSAELFFLASKRYEHSA